MTPSSTPTSVRKAYPSDLNDREWEIIAPLLPKPKGFGHPRTTDLREVVNAIFYVIRSGCQWEMLPHDFPHHSTVYSYFSKWKRKGIWQAIHDKLRVEVREKVGKKAQATAAIAASQTVKTAEKGEVWGFDGGKLIKGRKRHLVVDTLGLVIGVIVTEGNAPERVGAVMVLAEAEDKVAELQLLWVDQGYTGENFSGAVEQICGANVEVIKRTQKEFEILPKRWIVERTFGWFNWYRRLSKDYELCPSTSEAMIYGSMIRLMLRRLSA